MFRALRVQVFRVFRVVGVWGFRVLVLGRLGLGLRVLRMKSLGCLRFRVFRVQVFGVRFFTV